MIESLAALPGRCAATKPAIGLRLQSMPPVGRVAEIGS